jgi:choline-sulfatase
VRTPTALPDLYPTVLDVAGVAAGDVDGDSLRPILEGTGYLPLRPLYWETHNPRAVHRQAVRKGRYKLRRPKGGAPLELFDLAVDPTESTNLAADPALCPVLLDLIATLNAAHQPSPIDPDGRYDIPPLPLECPGGG